MAIIKNVIGREILDSRGNPTVEAEIVLDNGIKALASVPSGASTGSREALELRDLDKKRYHGNGVLKAVNNINTIIKNALVGQELLQPKIDNILINLDKTPYKSNLGANAILAVSLGCLKAAALSENKELYEYVSSGKVSMPIPMMNIINGGKHADSSLEIQEFMIVPVMPSFKERLRAGSEIYHTLKNILKSQNQIVSVGDEGGFAPRLNTNEQALDLIVEAIMKSDYIPGKDIYIALDIAANEIYNKDTNKYKINKAEISVDELIEYYKMLISKYPIISIEDAFMEKDFVNMAKLTQMIGDKIMLVGDDFFVTNTVLLQKGIDNHANNAILLKANQIGTISEMIDTIVLAKKNNFKMIISHRSGETEDTFIADLAVGLNIPFIKAGSLSRTDRVAKYNRLLRIEEKLTK